jgi:acid phosphatase type 7
MQHRLKASSILVLSIGCASASESKLAADGTGDLSNGSAERVPAEAWRFAECGAGAFRPSGDERLDRAPYLQQVSATSADVLFTLDATTVSQPLELTRPDGSTAGSVAVEVDSSDPSGRQRIARLADLQPDQTYCYAIAGLTEPAGFHTAPLPDSGKPVQFVVFGDSGGGPLQGAVRDQLDTVRFDLMLHVGDIAYGSGTLAELESQFFAEYASILGSVPVFPTSGNHDYRTEGGAPFRQVFALPENGMPGGVERWYSFDWGDIHFVALDTERVDATQTAWLEDDLSRNLLPWTIVYLHRPPYSSGDHGSAGDVRRAFAPLFADHGVDVVFAGHDHDYERTDAIVGVTYIVTGGGGHGTRPVGRSSFTAYSEDVLHFVYGEVTTERMLLHAIDASGREFDSVRIDRATPLVPR